MIALPTGTHIWIAAGVTDLRRGFTGLSATIQTVLGQNPFSGHIFVFRGRRGDLIKLLRWDGGTETAYACLQSGSNVDASSGRKLKMEGSRLRASHYMCAK
jgi:transposase